MRIGVIHATINAVEPIMETAKRKYPDMKLLNFVNENLLDHANQVGGCDVFGMGQFLQLFGLAVQSELDGILIACSLYTDRAKQLQEACGIPVIGIDAPMIETCVQDGKKIGIIATTAASGPSAGEKIQRIAEKIGKKVTIAQEIVTEAMTSLKRGDVKTHNLLVAEAAGRLKEQGCDLAILAQITMACAAPEAEKKGIPILVSPDTGLERIYEAVMEERKR